MTSFRNAFFLALFLSIICHLTILSFFSFRMPIQKIPAVPFINFLGSFLGPYDTQITDKIPPAITFQHNQKIKLSNMPNSKIPASKETTKLPTSQHLPPSPKKTLPVLQTTSPMPTSSENNDIENQIKHEPLTLPNNDRY